MQTDDMEVRKDPVPVLRSADMFPGQRFFEGPYSYGVDDVREAIRLLKTADIPACIVGVNALRYYGAGRVTWVS